MNHEAESNKSHAEFAHDLSRISTFTPEMALALIVTILKETKGHPILAAESLIEVICAAQAAGKDINAFRVGMVKMKELADLIYEKLE